MGDSEIIAIELVNTKTGKTEMTGEVPEGIILSELDNELIDYVEEGEHFDKARLYYNKKKGD